MPDSLRGPKATADAVSSPRRVYRADLALDPAATRYPYGLSNLSPADFVPDGGMTLVDYFGVRVVPADPAVLSWLRRYSEIELSIDQHGHFTLPLSLLSARGLPLAELPGIETDELRGQGLAMFFPLPHPIPAVPQQPWELIFFAAPRAHLNGTGEPCLPPPPLPSSVMISSYLAGIPYARGERPPRGQVPEWYFELKRGRISWLVWQGLDVVPGAVLNSRTPIFPSYPQWDKRASPYWRGHYRSVGHAYRPTHLGVRLDGPRTATFERAARVQLTGDGQVVVERALSTFELVGEQAVFVPLRDLPSSPFPQQWQASLVLPPGAPSPGALHVTFYLTGCEIEQAADKP